MTVENSGKSGEENRDNEGKAGGKNNANRLAGEDKSSKKSETEVSSSSDNIQLAASGKPVGSNKEGKQPNVRLQKPVKDIRIVNLTKKIFASFPIKHEPCDPDESESAKTEESVKLPISSNEDSGSDVMMYISDEEVVYHAIRIDSQLEDIDKKSLYTEDGVAYFIRPIKDDELCDLVIEYLELIKETPKGVFCIDIGGNLLKEVNKDKNTSNVMESTPVVKKTEVATIEKPVTETTDQFEFQDDDQPGEGEIFLKPKTVQQMNTSQQSRKQELLKLYEERGTRNLQDKTKAKPVLKEQGIGLKRSTTVTKKPDNDPSVVPKPRKKRKTEKLIVDKKTDIPILELKMNMQVTHDIVNQTPQTAVVKKKAKTFETLMQSPGNNIQSEKLLEIYNSRLVTNTADDPDDGGINMELPELEENAHRFTGCGRLTRPKNPGKDTGNKFSDMAPLTTVTVDQPVDEKSAMMPPGGHALSDSRLKQMSTQQTMDIVQIKTEPMDAYNSDSMMETSDIGPPNQIGGFTKRTQSDSETFIQNKLPSNQFKKEMMSPSEILHHSVQMKMEKLSDVDRWGKFEEFDLDSMVNVVNRDYSNNRFVNDNFRVNQGDIDDIEALVTCINRKPTKSTSHKNNCKKLKSKGSNSTNSVGGKFQIDCNLSGTLRSVMTNFSTRSAEDLALMKELDIKDCSIRIDLNKDGSPRKQKSLKRYSPKSNEVSPVKKGSKNREAKDMTDEDVVVSPDNSTNKEKHVKTANDNRKSSKHKIGPKSKTQKNILVMSSSQQIATTDVGTKDNSKKAKKIAEKSSSGINVNHSKFSLDLTTKTLKLNLVRIDAKSRSVGADQRPNQPGELSYCLSQGLLDSCEQNENFSFNKKLEELKEKHSNVHSDEERTEPEQQQKSGDSSVERTKSNDNAKNTELGEKLGESGKIHENIDVDEGLNEPVEHNQIHDTDFKPSDSKQNSCTEHNQHFMSMDLQCSNEDNVIEDDIMEMSDSETDSLTELNKEQDLSNNTEHRKRSAEFLSVQPPKKAKLDCFDKMITQDAKVEQTKIQENRNTESYNNKEKPLGDTTGKKPTDENVRLTEKKQKTEEANNDSRKNGFTCRICRKYFNSKLMLKNHLRDYHKLKISQNKLKCKVCLELFRNEKLLLEHIMTHEDQKQKIKGGKEEKFKETKNKTWISHSEKQTKSLYRCLSCKESFESSVDYFSHLKYHQRKCEICSEDFKEEKLLARHMKMHKDTQCDICDRYFKTKEEMEKHYQVHKQCKETMVILPVQEKTKRSDSSNQKIKNSINHTDYKIKHREKGEPPEPQNEKSEKLERDKTKSSDSSRKSNKSSTKYTEKVFDDKEKEEKKKSPKSENNKQEKSGGDKTKTGDFRRKDKKLSIKHTEKIIESHKQEEKRRSVKPKTGTSEKSLDKLKINESIKKGKKLSFKNTEKVVKNNEEETKMRLADPELDTSEKSQGEKSKHDPSKKGKKLSLKHFEKVVEIDKQEEGRRGSPISENELLEGDSGSPIDTIMLEDETLPQTILFPCIKCPDVFTSKDECEEHMKTHRSLNKTSDLLGRAIFPCTKCSGLFMKKEDLVKHLKVHEETEIRCDICSQQFGSTQHLEEHKETHKEPPNTKCDVCFLTFGTVEELNEHKKSHEIGERHKCDLCFKCFKRRDDLLEHRELEHNIIDKECKQCRQIFISALDYENHNKKKCQALKKCGFCSATFKSRLVLEEHIKTHEVQNDFSCGVCSKKFDKAEELQNHISSHTAHKCSICFKTFPSENILNEHMKVHYGKNCQTCKQCMRYFPSEEEYLKHENEVHPDEVFKCDTCLKCFSSLIALQGHMSVHIPEVYKCKNCDRSFNSENQLSKHVKNDHMEGMSYMCGQCHIPFKTEKQLTKHVEECHDKVEYKCGVCEKLFLSEKKLMDHLVLHQAEFQCGICQQSFSEEVELVEHINTHTVSAAIEYACNKCGHKFIDEQALLKHSENCEIVKEYQCGYCKCYFSSNEILVQHVISHMSCPAFTCDVCGEVFTSKDDHERHQHSSEKQRVFKCGLCTYIGLTRNMLMKHLEGHL